jgi:hypothetical protein
LGIYATTKLISVEEEDGRQPLKEMNTNCRNMEKGDT